MSAKGSPLRALGMKCQLTRSSLFNSNTALACCSGVSVATKLLAASAIAAPGDCARADVTVEDSAGNNSKVRTRVREDFMRQRQPNRAAKATEKCCRVNPNSEIQDPKEFRIP